MAYTGPCSGEKGIKKAGVTKDHIPCFFELTKPFVASFLNTLLCYLNFACDLRNNFDIDGIAFGDRAVGVGEHRGKAVAAEAGRFFPDETRALALRVGNA